MVPGGSRLLGRRGSLTAVGLVAVLVYANTLLGDFTFDDNFAVINNGDVTNPASPIRDLFKHDFWGQDITSTQSHKSYRPFTILVFRLTHQAWKLLTAAMPGVTQLLPTLPASQQPQQDEATPERPDGLHPFPFHVLCVAMHAVASMLVLGLCQHLFGVLEESCRPASLPDAEGLTHRSSSSSTSSGTGKPCSQGLWRQLIMWQQQPQLWRLPSSSKYRAQALLAGLMFALHPIHTEAVAGIVGCAELICVALSCPALLCYFMAVDGRYAAAQQLQDSQADAAPSTAASHKQHSTRPAAKQQQSTPPAAAAAGAAPPYPLWAADVLQHWLLVLAAAVLAFCAALSKEIGVAVIGTMLLYDALMAPHLRVHSGSNSSSSSSSSSSTGQRSVQTACRRQLVRMVLIAATAVAYVKMRQWVAVQQLVQIYRKVENPIPFADSRVTRVLSTGYLHARYTWLLFMPLHLSADWSFSCIPLVEHWADVRNLATLALYCYLLYTALAAQPISLMGQLWHVAVNGVRPEQSRSKVRLQPSLAANGKAAAKSKPEEPSGSPTAAYTGGSASASAASAASCARRRWRLLVLVGLVVAPFFPASNVLFYVGTFIGERLLYSPSIGFCLLVAELLGAVLPDTWQQQGATAQQPEAEGKLQTTPQQGVDAAKQQGSDQHLPTPKPGLKAESKRAGSPPTSHRNLGVLLLCGVLLAGYSARTVLRNQDWWDEERLFVAALRVCPDSAKVQQNNGVLQRRFKNYTAALEHFKRAQEIEPGYCEPTYWIGMTTFNMGDPLTGLSTMKASLSCKYTASEALQALNKVYLMMMEAGKNADVGPMLEWAAVLASPHVLRLADACSTAEDAALGAALAGKPASFVNKAIEVCTGAIHEWEHAPVKADSLAALSKEKLGDTNTTLLAECVKMRRAVYKKMAIHGLRSAPTKQATYKYLARVQDEYAGCRTLEGGGPMVLENEGNGSSNVSQPSSHQKLLHKVQAADPEDPWLQYEWGATLLALGPTTHIKEAAMHMEVAAAIFAKASQDLMAGGQQQGAGAASANKGSQPLMLHLTELDGQTPLTPLTALQAAMRPLATFIVAADEVRGADDGVAGKQVCDIMQRLCHLKLQVVLVRQQMQSAAAAGTAHKLEEGLQGAMKAARQCMADIGQRPGCSEQAAKLHQMVRVK